MLETMRKLAHSNKYQLLYNRSKEMYGIQMFNNKTNLTKLQVLFLYWLEVYNGLYSDLAKEEKHISMEVIKDTIRCDAYLTYRTKKREWKKLEDKSQRGTDPKLIGIPSLMSTEDGEGSWLMKNNI